MIPKTLQNELDALAFRRTLWVCIYLAQGLCLHEIAGRLTAMLIEVNEQLEAAA